MKPKPLTTQLLQGPTTEYVVGERLGQTEVFSLYACTLPDGGPGILKIARQKANNGTLDREAFILQTLLHGVNTIDPENNFQYLCSFPVLHENFISEEQDGRRVLILDFSKMCEQLSELTPLGHLLSREHIRVDPKTSVWILGKQLKLLTLTHMLGVTCNLTPDNVLIHRDRHYVSVFDWSSSQITTNVVDEERAQLEIKTAAQLTIAALGGDSKTGIIPADDQYLGSETYQATLQTMVSGKTPNAMTAHEQFYAMVHKLWPSKFHPFAAYAVK